MSLAARRKTEVAPALELRRPTDPRGLGGFIARLAEREVPFPLREIKVRAQIAGPHARTSVDLIYTNPLEQAADVEHIFPLPDRGAVIRLELHAGDTMVYARCVERSEGGRLMSAAREQGKLAAALDQARDDIHNLAIIGLEPGQEVRVRLEILEVLSAVDGRFRWRFPTTIPERFMPGEPIGHAGPGVAPDTNRVPEGSFLQPPLQLSSGARLDLEVTLEPPVRRVHSSMHTVHFSIEPEGLKVCPSTRAQPDRDFVLEFDTNEDRVLALRAWTDGMHTLAVLGAPLIPEGAIIPRDVVLILDASSSMKGPKFEAAKRGLKSLIRGLGRGDRFRLLAFRNQVASYGGQGFHEPGPETCEAACQWLESITADKDKDFLAAIRAALVDDTPEGRIRTVLLISDGQAWGDRDLALAVARRRFSTRIFVLGVDTSPNGPLLRLIARLGGGSCELAGPDEAIESLVERLSGRFFSPLAEDLRLSGGAVAREDPAVLFAGRPVSWLIEGAPAQIKLSGRRGADDLALEVRPARTRFPLGASWARDRIAALEDRLLIEPDQEPALRPKIVELALQYGLASRFTSLVAVESKAREVGPRAALSQGALAPISTTGGPLRPAVRPKPPQPPKPRPPAPPSPPTSSGIAPLPRSSGIAPAPMTSSAITPMGSAITPVMNPGSPGSSGIAPTPAAPPPPLPSPPPPPSTTRSSARRPVPQAGGSVMDSGKMAGDSVLGRVETADERFLAMIAVNKRYISREILGKALKYRQEQAAGRPLMQILIERGLLSSAQYQDIVNTQNQTKESGLRRSPDSTYQARPLIDSSLQSRESAIQPVPTTDSARGQRIMDSSKLKEGDFQRPPDSRVQPAPKAMMGSDKQGIINSRIQRRNDPFRTPVEQQGVYESSKMNPRGPASWQIDAGILDASGDLDLVGKQLGNCTIERKIGEGSMGAVYQARHGKLNREVVVKVLPPKAASIERNCKRFTREARAAARLEHPNIVQVYDVDKSPEGLYYIVMQYVRGRNLQQEIDIKGAHTWQDATELVLQVAQGLKAAHDNNIIHRDIKAENILVSEQGRAKIADFGLAKDLESSIRITKDGAFIGTPLYMAPEIGRVGKIDGRVDIFSLGITYYYLLTSVQPLRGFRTMEILSAKAHDKIKDPRELVEDLPEPVFRLLGKMLAKDRDQRYKTVKELIAEVERVLRGEPIRAGLPPLWSSASAIVQAEAAPKPKEDPTVRRLQIAIAVAILLIVALVLVMSRVL